MATEIDDRGFGKAVQTYRGWLNLSQRGLAERLTDMGWSIDASALSRLEQGKRSVRLAEALAIAEALETDISALLDISPDTRQRFAAMRRRANQAMHSAVVPVAEMLEAFLESMAFADSNPDVVQSLIDDDFGSPDVDAGGYTAWVLQRLERTMPLVRVVDELEAERAEAIMRAWTHRLTIIGGTEVDDNEDEEAAG